jgi:hypothetical protein
LKSTAALWHREIGGNQAARYRLAIAEQRDNVNRLKIHFSKMNEMFRIN